MCIDYGRLDEDMAERMSAMRVEGESELDYYERRHQERVSLYAINCIIPRSINIINYETPKYFYLSLVYVYCNKTNNMTADEKLCSRFLH